MNYQEILGYAQKSMLFDYIDVEYSENMQISDLLFSSKQIILSKHYAGNYDEKY